LFELVSLFYFRFILLVRSTSTIPLVRVLARITANHHSHGTDLVILGYG